MSEIGVLRIDSHIRELLYALANGTERFAAVWSTGREVEVIAGVIDDSFRVRHKAGVVIELAVSEKAIRNADCTRENIDPFHDLTRLPTVKRLALAVLLGDNAGPALVDELISHGNIDVDGEFAKKVRRETLEQVAAVLDKLVHDESVSRMGASQREWFSAGYRIDGLLHIRQLISELA